MPAEQTDFDRDKWLSEQRFRERELALKEREQAEREAGGFEARRWEQERSLREHELSLKERAQTTSEQDLAFRRSETRRARWSNPLIVAILAAAVAGLGNAVVAFVNGREGQDLETTRAESARILEMIKTGSADKAAENLKFLADAGLVENARLLSGIKTFLASRAPGQGPSLPVSGTGSVEPVRELKETDPMLVVARAVGEVRSDQGSLCTGFRLSRNLVLTLDFCVEGSHSLTFATISSKGKTAETSALILPAKEVIHIPNDASLGLPLELAILETKSPTNEVPAQLSLSTSAPSGQQQLVTIAVQMGPAGNVEPVIARDAACSVREVHQYYFAHTCALSPGSSGAPLLSSDGVLGIEVGSRPQLEFAVRADQVVANSKILQDLYHPTP
jgi:V8-like Glu-specific endopeptidase